MVFASGVQVGGFVCSVPGCVEPVYARGLCRPHYDRDRRSGSPERPVMQRLCPLGHWFEPKRVDQVFCSDRHRALYAYRSKRNPREYPPKSKPKLFKAPRPVPENVDSEVRWELFTDGQVVAECGGVCQVCGLPVVLGSSGSDGPAYMWRVPLEKCREASLRNRMLVHRRCRGGTP